MKNFIYLYLCTLFTSCVLDGNARLSIARSPSIELNNISDIQNPGQHNISGNCFPENADVFVECGGSEVLTSCISGTFVAQNVKVTSLPASCTGRVIGNNNERIEDTKDTDIVNVDLEITLSVDTQVPFPDQDITYTYTLTALNQKDISDLVISSLVCPIGTTYKSSSATHGSYSDSTKVFNLISLGQSNSFSTQLDITCTIGSSQFGNTIENSLISNQVSIAPHLLDNNISNHLPSQPITVSSLPACTSCNISRVVQGGNLRVESATFDPIDQNYTVDVIDQNGDKIVVYATGTSFIDDQHLPLRQGIIVSPGTYLLSAKSETCACQSPVVIDVPTYDVCSTPITANYDGPTVGPGSNPTFSIPINPDMTSVDINFRTNVAPDKFIIKYDGNIIFDSGFVTGINTFNSPLTYSPGVDFAEIQVFPDTSNSSTYWSFAIGCCLSQTCNLPDRDLLIHEIREPTGVNRNCASTFSIKSPYTKPSLSFLDSIGYYPGWQSTPPDSYTKNITGENLACFSDNNSTISAPTYISIGACTALEQRRYTNCIDLSTVVTAQELSPTSARATFVNLVDYNSFKSMFNSAVALVTNGTNQYYEILGMYKEGTCASDLNLQLLGFGPINLNLLTFDDVNMHVNLDLTSVDTSSLDCCSNFNKELSIDKFVNAMNRNIQSLDSLTLTRYGNNPSGLGTQISGDTYKSSISLDIDNQCADYTRDYTLTYDITDIAGTFNFFRGDENTGLLLQSGVDYVDTYFSETTTDSPTIISDINPDYVIDCENINFLTQAFDLTEIDPNAINTTFTSGVLMTSYLQSITGDSWIWNPGSCFPTRLDGGSTQTGSMGVFPNNPSIKKLP